MIRKWLNFIINKTYCCGWMQSVRGLSEANSGLGIISWGIVCDGIGGIAKIIYYRYRELYIYNFF